MTQGDQFTIIDNATMRGVIAPAGAMSKEMLIDLVDFLELSSPQSMKETDDLLADSRNNDKKISLSEVLKELEDSDNKE